jgi:hypothetical protein
MQFGTGCPAFLQLSSLCTREHTLSQPGQLNPRRRVDVECETGGQRARRTIDGSEGHRVREFGAHRREEAIQAMVNCVCCGLPSTDGHVIYLTCCKHDFACFLGKVSQTKRTLSRRCFSNFESIPVKSSEKTVQWDKMDQTHLNLQNNCWRVMARWSDTVTLSHNKHDHTNIFENENGKPWYVCKAL